VFVSDKENQKLNPPRSPLVRGDDVSHRAARGSRGAADAPPLTRGGREGLGFLPYDPKLTTLARANRKNPTPAEQKIWFEILRNRQFAAYKFLRQKPIDRFIVDFYCAKLHLVIEIDGDSHAEDLAYDIERTKILHSYGLTVVRYANRDVLHNISGVYDDLIERIS
jgi:very-short-patch-repair endonuclease